MRKRLTMLLLAVTLLALLFSASAVFAAESNKSLKYWPNPSSFASKISGAVESGKLTQAEADEKLAALKAKAGDGKKQGKMKKGHRGGPGALVKRLAGAVESGKLTQAEADEKLAALKAKAGSKKNPKTLSK